MPTGPADDLARYLADTRLAGSVTTTPRSTLDNCRKMVSGHPDYTFGLPDWTDTRVLEAVEAVRSLCGGDPGGAEDLDGPGWIEPDFALAAIERHREVLCDIGTNGGGKALFATGHPTGLLPHYAAIARALQDAGCELVTPLDDERWDRSISEHARGMRFLDGVGCVFDGGTLYHTHRSLYMESMLDRVDSEGVELDLVVADHGMAGAAIARGILTLSIADVNDPALPVAQVRGRTDAVLPIDDNLAPRLFTRVTEAMLDWSRKPSGRGGRRRNR